MVPNLKQEEQQQHDTFSKIGYEASSALGQDLLNRLLSFYEMV